MKQTTEGLTLIEVIVASAMLVIVLGLTASILSALSTTRGSAQNAQAVNNVQQAAELLRGRWADPALYRGVCLNPQGTLAAAQVSWPAGVNIVEVRNVDILGNPGTAENGVRVNCNANEAALLTTPAAPVRQVTLRGQDGGQQRTLVITVMRP